MPNGQRRRYVHRTTRNVLLGLLVGSLVLGAGCSGVLSEDAPTREMKLVNQDDTTHAVVVEISDESGLIYSDGRTVDAESDLNLAQFNRTGEYELKVTVDGTSTTVTHTFESDGGPIHVTNIGIDEQGAVTVE